MAVTDFLRGKEVRRIGELFFNQDHLWARPEEDGHATVGISDYLQETVGEILSIQLPEEGEELIKDEVFGFVEGQNGRHELIAPVSGEIIEINDELAEVPELANEEPYDDGWLVRLEVSAAGEFDDLLTQEEYEDYLNEMEGVDLEEFDEEEDEEDEEDE